MTVSDRLGSATHRVHSIPPRVAYVLVALLGMAGVAVLYVFDPRIPGNYPVCPFLGITGYHCPGCGTLRALHQLLHGSLVSGLGYNPLAALTLPFIMYSWATGAMRAFRIPAPRTALVPHQLIWALVVGIAVFWVLRNVPVDPLTVLAP